MKHLKLFESFKEEEYIQFLCDNLLKIRNYTINDDGSVDVDGDIDLHYKDLNILPPIKFRNVTGNFYCDHNNLDSLKGSPKSVGGDFSCWNNKSYLSLEGAPESVGGYFNCSACNLTSLEGCPESVGGGFDCQNNKIVTFEHLPISIGGSFYCASNPIWEVWYLFMDYSKIEFLNDCDALREPDDDFKEPIIILDRLNYFLEEIGKKPVTEVKGYKCI